MKGKEGSSQQTKTFAQWNPIKREVFAPGAPEGNDVLLVGGFEVI